MKPVQPIYPTLTERAKQAPLTTETRGRMPKLSWKARVAMLDDLVAFLFERRCTIVGIRTAATLALEAIEAPTKIRSMDQAVCYAFTVHAEWSVPAFAFMERELIKLIRQERPMKWRKRHPGLSRLLSEMAAA